MKAMSDIEFHENSRKNRKKTKFKVFFEDSAAFVLFAMLIIIAMIMVDFISIKLIILLVTFALCCEIDAMRKEFIKIRKTLKKRLKKKI